MVPILAYKMQESSMGSLHPNAIRKLSRIADSIRADRTLRLDSSLAIKSGTRLVRQWQSQTHVVHVEEQGYEYKGSRYNSLSEIARLSQAECKGRLSASSIGSATFAPRR